MTLTESYPAHLSGLLAFEKFIGKEGDARAWFPERQEGREIETLSAHAATVKAGEEGWLAHIKEKIEFLPKEDTSLTPFAIGYKGHSKQGMSVVHTPQPVHVEVPEKDLSLRSKEIHLRGPVIKVPQGKVMIEALERLWVEHARVIENLVPYYSQRKGKIYEHGGWREKYFPTLIKGLEVVLKSQGEIMGHYPQVSSAIQYEAPFNNLTHPIPLEELYSIVVGHVSKGNAGLAMVVGLAAAIGSAGLATPAAMAAMFGEVGSVIASATIASVASQTASSMVMHQGNIKQVGKDLTSSRALKSYAIAGASAGLCHQLSGPLNLPTQPKGFTQHFKVNLVRSGVSAGLNMTIGGMKPEDALLSAARMMAAGTLGGLGANEIAQIYSEGQLDYLTHKLTHALLGAGMGTILSKDVAQGAASGAIGGFFGEIGGETLVDRLGDKQLTTVLGQMDETVMKVQLMAAIATGLIGQDAGVATFVAENAIRNNSFLVKAILKKVASKSAARETTKTSKKVAKLADKVEKRTGGVKTPSKGEGYSIQIPNGSHPIKVRIMEKGGQRSTPYYRVTVKNKGTVTKLGEYSSNPHLTHLELHKNSLDEIVNIIKILKN